MINKDGIPDKSWRPSLVTLETNLGAFAIELYWQHVRLTCRNFSELSRRGYYNGVKFHRCIPNFMIQTGDSTGTGRGGTSIYGGAFNDEVHPELTHSGAGIVSMVNSGPNTNGSQFFITLAPCQCLDGEHTIFGRVFSEMGVVKRIGNVETNKNDCPLNDVTILHAKINES